MSIRQLINTAGILLVIALLLLTATLYLALGRVSKLENGQCEVWAIPQGACERF